MHGQASHPRPHPSQELHYWSVRAVSACIDLFSVFTLKCAGIKRAETERFNSSYRLLLYIGILMFSSNAAGVELFIKEANHQCLGALS